MNSAGSLAPFVDAKQFRGVFMLVRVPPVWGGAVLRLRAALGASLGRCRPLGDIRLRRDSTGAGSPGSCTSHIGHEHGFWN